MFDGLNPSSANCLAMGTPPMTVIPAAGSSGPPASARTRYRTAAGHRRARPGSSCQSASGTRLGSQGCPTRHSRGRGTDRRRDATASCQESCIGEGSADARALAGRPLSLSRRKVLVPECVEARPPRRLRRHGPTALRAQAAASCSRRRHPVAAGTGRGCATRDQQGKRIVGRKRQFSARGWRVGPG